MVCTKSDRQWFFIKMDDVLSKLHCHKLNWCNCMYMFRTRLVLLLCVDNIVLFGETETKDDLDFRIGLLRKHFNLKILRTTRKLLGIEFEEIRNYLFIYQTSYIEKS